MARKKDLSDKLSTPTERPGWRETITSGQAQPEQVKAAQPAAPDMIVRKTFLLTPDLVTKINRLAKLENVGINELVRYLLNEAIEQVNSEQLKVPTKPSKRRIVT